MPLNASSNTNSALQCFDGTVVAVASCIGGPTTARLISQALRPLMRGTVLSSDEPGQSFQRDWTYRLRPDHQYAVIDLSSSPPSAVKELENWNTPWVGIVGQRFETVGGCRDEAPTAEATSLLLSSLPPDGWAILDGDDRLLRKWEAATNARVIRVGRGPDCDLGATEVKVTNGSLEFKLEEREFRIPGCDRSLLHAALSAVAVGRVFGVSLAAIAQSLAEFGASDHFTVQRRSFVHLAHLNHRLPRINFLNPSMSRSHL